MTQFYLSGQCCCSSKDRNVETFACYWELHMQFSVSRWEEVGESELGSTWEDRYVQALVT